MSLLQSVLQAREDRFIRKLQLIERGAVVSAILRAPQSLRTEPDFIRVHGEMCKRLEAKFRASGRRLEPVCDIEDAEGPCRLWISEDAAAAKRLCMESEAEPGGALMDFDVMDECGRMISRAELGEGPRACVVCGENARLCIAGARHERGEVEKAARRLALAFWTF